MCSACGKIGAPVKCACCLFTPYCNVGCQKADWPLHKNECNNATPERKESITILRQASKNERLVGLVFGLHNKFGLVCFVQPGTKGTCVYLGLTKASECTIVHACKDGTTPFVVLHSLTSHSALGPNTFIVNIPNEPPERLFFLVREDGISAYTR